MKYLFFCSIIIISFFTLESCSDSASTNDSRDVIKPLGTVEDAIPDQYIVQLKNDVVGPPSLLKLDRSKNYSREEKGSLMEKLNDETETKFRVRKCSAKRSSSKLEAVKEIEINERY